jgi:hypothetical protein
MLLAVRMASAASAQTVPSSVVQVLPTERNANGNFQVRVKNLSAKEITALILKEKSWAMPAWQLPYEDTHVPPGETQPLGSTVDNWGADREDGSRPVVLAVVFADGSAMGDEEAINAIFERRQAWADRLEYWYDRAKTWGSDNAQFRAAMAKELRPHMEADARGSEKVQLMRSARDQGVSLADNEVKAMLTYYDNPQTVLVDLGHRTAVLRNAARRLR